MRDVENLFGSDLLAFMKRKGYSTEAEYIEAVHNWRQACDERGLSTEIVRVTTFAVQLPTAELYTGRVEAMAQDPL